MAISTPKQAAEWMLRELKREGVLPQGYAALELYGAFGDLFVYQNKNGNPGIHKKVLREFKKLSKALAVWDARKRYWRLRAADDPPERRTVGW